MRQPGIPKTKRKKKDDEAQNPSKLKRIGLTMTCSRCVQQGHNKGFCKKSRTKLSLILVSWI